MNNENLELSETVETTFDTEEEGLQKAKEIKESVNVFQEIIQEYLDRIKTISEAYQRGEETDVTIGDLISDGSRRDGESYEDYKMRLKAEKMISKHYRKGIRISQE